MCFKSACPRRSIRFGATTWLARASRSRICPREVLRRLNPVQLASNSPPTSTVNSGGSGRSCSNRSGSGRSGRSCRAAIRQRRKHLVEHRWRRYAAALTRSSAAHPARIRLPKPALEPNPQSLPAHHLGANANPDRTTTPLPTTDTRPLPLADFPPPTMVAPGSRTPASTTGAPPASFQPMSQNVSQCPR